MVRVLQKKRTRTSKIYIYREIYYEELSHESTEAEKSHDLWPASWRTGKPGIQFKGLRARELTVEIPVSVSRPENQEHREQKTDILAQTISRMRAQPSSAFLFYFRSSMAWRRPTHSGEGHLLYSVHLFKC